MVYDRDSDIAVIERVGFDLWFDNESDTQTVVIDDILPQISASGDLGHHGYDGMGLSWHHGYDGMGVF